MTLEGRPRQDLNPSDFDDYFRILLARRRLIAGFVALACALALALSLIGPEVYRAQVTLIVEESSGISMPAGLSDNPLIMDLLASGGGSYRPGRIYVEMLSSRSVMEGVVNQLDLVEVFDNDRMSPEAGMEESITRLDDMTDFLETDAGLIRVAARAGTPFFPGPPARRRAAELAAAISNAFADQLNRVNQEKGASRSRAVRVYLGEQIEEMSAGLRNAADSLARFQLENRAVALEEQTKATVEGAGELRGQIAATEIELGVLERTRRPGNPEVQAARSRLEELRKQYARIAYGGGPVSPEATSRDFLVPFASLPAIGRQLAELTLDVRIKQTVLELLTAQYYQARINETRDVPSLTVLDKGIPPVRRHWPKRKTLLVTTFLVSFLAAAAFALVMEQQGRRKGLRAAPAPLTLAAAWEADRSALASLVQRRSTAGGSR